MKLSRFQKAVHLMIMGPPGSGKIISIHNLIE